MVKVLARDRALPVALAHSSEAATAQILGASVSAVATRELVRPAVFGEGRPTILRVRV